MFSLTHADAGCSRATCSSVGLTLRVLLVRLLHASSDDGCKTNFMSKEGLVLKTVKFGTGYHAIARTASEARGAFRRLGSLFDLLARDQRKQIVRPNGERYVVFTPYLYQYGTYTRMEDGQAVFMPEGVANSLNEVPPGKVVQKGAYFCGNDFGALIDDVFTPEQQEEMIYGAQIKKAIVVTGAVSTLVIIVGFVLTGRWFALASLPMVALFLAMAIKYGVYIERLRAKEIIGLSEYFRRRGLIRGIFA